MVRNCELNNNSDNAVSEFFFSKLRHSVANYYAIFVHEQTSMTSPKNYTNKVIFVAHVSDICTVVVVSGIASRMRRKKHAKAQATAKFRQNERTLFLQNVDKIIIST